MKASTLVRPRTMMLTSTDEPKITDREVLLKIEYCGVCASSLGPWKGAPWFSYPFAPGSLGHEATGVVEQVGAAVTLWKPGDRVAALSQKSFAEYDAVSEDAIISIPADFGEKPFLGEPVACAINVMRRSAVSEGQIVAIVGLGFLGLLLTQLCSRAGARVLAVGRSDFTLHLAESFGATPVKIVSYDRTAVVRSIGDITHQQLCDVVIEATGYQQSLDLAGELCRIRGRLVIAGYHQDGPRSINMQLWNWRGLDVINAHERDASVYLSGLKEGLMAIQSERLNLAPLLTHTFPLEELGTAFELMERRPEGFIKAITIP